jgi:hypothetical protein
MTPGIDAAVDASSEIVDGTPCEPVCSGTNLQTCPNGELVACPLGCIPTSEKGPAHCGNFAPANGFDLLWASGTKPLLVNDPFVFDTDTGAIYRCMGDTPVQIRKAVVDGVDDELNIYFTIKDGIGVFGTTTLTVQSGEIVRGIGANALGFLVSGTAEVDGGSVRMFGGPRNIDLAHACGGGDGQLVSSGGVGAGDGGLADTSANGGGQTGSELTRGGGGGGASGTGGLGGKVGGAGGGLSGGLTPLRGGSGGAGGRSGNTECGGAGGGGGGAIQISAGESISISFEGAIDTDGIFANGAGGRRAGGGCGAGGGGAGGTIVLDSPLVSVSARLVAKGGGGGMGDCGVNENPCDGDGPGSASTAYTTAALVGGAIAPDSSNRGGNGGAGGAPNGVAGLPVDNTGNGGGGGGGAAGHIIIRTKPLGGTLDFLQISPTPQLGSIDTR